MNGPGGGGGSGLYNSINKKGAVLGYSIFMRAVVFLEFHRSIRTKCTVERN